MVLVHSVLPSWRYPKKTKEDQNYPLHECTHDRSLPRKLTWKLEAGTGQMDFTVPVAITCKLRRSQPKQRLCFSLTSITIMTTFNEAWKQERNNMDQNLWDKRKFLSSCWSERLFSERSTKVIDSSKKLQHGLSRVCMWLKGTKNTCTLTAFTRDYSIMQAKFLMLNFSNFHDFQQKLRTFASGELSANDCQYFLDLLFKFQQYFATVYKCRLNEKVLFKFTNFCFTKHELSLGLNESLLRQKGSVILISGMIYFYSWGLLCTIHTCCIIVITFTSKQWLRQSKESSCTISKNKNHWIAHLSN